MKIENLKGLRNSKNRLLLWSAILCYMSLEVLASPPVCLYCKAKDREGSFVSEWSYCETLDVCVENVWNYLDYQCPSEWIRANNVTFEDCGVVETVCPQFESTSLSYGVTTTTTQALASGEECAIYINAQQAVARMTIQNTYDLEIKELIGYIYGEVITIAEGSERTLTLYNANQYGNSITFTLSFSSAVQNFHLLGAALANLVLIIALGF